MPWIQESFVWLDHSQHGGRAKADQTRTMSTADIFRVLATWAWRPLQITSEKKVSSRYRLECQSVRPGSIITIQKQLWQHCRWCYNVNPTWGAVVDLGQRQQQQRSKTVRQPQINNLGVCLVLNLRKKSQRLPSSTVISVTRCKRCRPLYDRPDICPTFLRYDTNVVWTVRRGPLLLECAVMVGRPYNRSSW